MSPIPSPPSIAAHNAGAHVATSTGTLPSISAHAPARSEPIAPRIISSLATKPLALSSAKKPAHPARSDPPFPAAHRTSGADAAEATAETKTSRRKTPSVERDARTSATRAATSAYVARNIASLEPLTATRSAVDETSGGAARASSKPRTPAWSAKASARDAAIVSATATTVSGATRLSAARVAAARRSPSLRRIASDFARDSRSSPSPPTFPPRLPPLPAGSPSCSSGVFGVSAATGIDRPASRFRQSSSYRLGSSRGRDGSSSTTTTVLVPRRLLTPARVGSLKPSYAKSAHLTNDFAALILAVLTRTGTPHAWNPSAHRRSLSLTPRPLRSGSTHSLSTCALFSEPPGLAT